MSEVQMFIPLLASLLVVGLYLAWLKWRRIILSRAVLQAAKTHKKYKRSICILCKNKSVQWGSSLPPAMTVWCGFKLFDDHSPITGTKNVLRDPIKINHDGGCESFEYDSDAVVTANMEQENAF